MSVQAMTAVFNHSKSRACARLVLLAIADRAESDGTGCRFAVRTIARKAHVTERGVQKCLRQLEELGELETEIGKGQNGTNRYRIVLPGLEPPEQSSPPHPEHNDTPPPEQRSPKTKVLDQETEGSKEPSRGSNGEQVSKYPRELWNPLWDAFAAILPEPATSTERSIRGKCVKELMDAGATPGDIEARAGRWSDVYASATLTDLALVKHWSMLKPPEPPRSQYPTREEYAAAGIEW